MHETSLKIEKTKQIFLAIKDCYTLLLNYTLYFFSITIRGASRAFKETFI